MTDALFTTSEGEEGTRISSPSSRSRPRKTWNRCGVDIATVLRRRSKTCALNLPLGSVLPGHQTRFGFSEHKRWNPRQLDHLPVRMKNQNPSRRAARKTDRISRV